MVFKSNIGGIQIECRRYLNRISAIFKTIIGDIRNEYGRYWMGISLEVGEGKGETDFLKQGNCGGAEVVDVKELYVAGCVVVMWRCRDCCVVVDVKELYVTACVWWLCGVVVWMFHSLDVFSFFRFYIMV